MACVSVSISVAPFIGQVNRDLRGELRDLPDLRGELRDLPDLRGELRDLPDLRKELRDLPALRGELRDWPERIRDKLDCEDCISSTGGACYVCQDPCIITPDTRYCTGCLEAHCPACESRCELSLVGTGPVRGAPGLDLSVNHDEMERELWQQLGETPHLPCESA